jgi:Domain of unknown function (DUF6647)
MRKTFIVLLWVALLTFANKVEAIDAQSKSSPPSDRFLQEILDWLPANFDLPAGKAAPAIKFLSYQRLAAMRYDRDAGGSKHEPSAVSEHERNVLALYDDRSETIFLPFGWTGTTPAEQSILVHEMVHHLQKVGGLGFDCPMAREKLAFLAQDRWLERFGSNIEQEFGLDKFTLLISSACLY